MIEFFVQGIPVAKGSAKAFYNKKVKRAFVIQDNAARQKPWVSMISVKAIEAGLTLSDQPVELSLVFRMPRPKAHFNSKGKLKDDSPSCHKSKPDLDKLIRAVLDALTTIAYKDDSQVWSIAASKIYADIPGVLIRVKLQQVVEVAA